MGLGSMAGIGVPQLDAIESLLKAYKADPGFGEAISKLNKARKSADRRGRAADKRVKELEAVEKEVDGKVRHMEAREEALKIGREDLATATDGFERRKREFAALMRSEKAVLAESAERSRVETQRVTAQAAELEALRVDLEEREEALKRDRADMDRRRSAMKELVA